MTTCPVPTIYSARTANCGGFSMPTVVLLARIGGQVVDLPTDVQLHWQMICPAPISYSPTTGILSVGESHFNLKQVILAEVFGNLKDCNGNSITPASRLTVCNP